MKTVWVVIAGDRRLVLRVYGSEQRAEAYRDAWMKDYPDYPAWVEAAEMEETNA